MPDTANIKSDNWLVTIGGTEQEFEASVSVSGGYDIHDVQSQKTGTDIIASLVQGRRFALTFEIQEDVATVLIRALGLGGAGDQLDVGAQLPVSQVTLHPASVDSGTQTENLYLYAVRFGTLERTSDGQGPAIWKLTAEATRDANGKVGRVGADPA